jgi:putative inorganic carbon (hco3(-)) transporter
MEELKIHWFNWAQGLIAVMLAPLFIFPNMKLWPIFLVLPLLLIMRYKITRECIEKTPLNIPLFIFFCAILVSLPRLPDLNNSLPKISGLVFGMFFYYVMVSVLKTKRLIKFGLSVYLLGGIALSVIGLLGMPTFTVKHLDSLEKIKDKIPTVHFNLPGAEMGFSTNAVAGTLLLIFPLFLVLVLRLWLRRWWPHPDQPVFRSKRPLLVLSLGCFFTGGVLLLTQSRGAWGGLFLSGLIMALVYLGRRVKTRKMVTLVAMILPVVILLTGLTLYAVKHISPLAPGIKQAEGTLQFRIHVWNLTLPIIRDNPWCGIGLNNFRTMPEVRYFWSSAHNQFLHVAVEMGLPALIAYLALLFLVAYMCLHIREKSSISWVRTSILGLGWGHLAFLFFGLTDAIPLGAKVGFVFWLSIGLITALYKYTAYHKQKSSE